MKLEDIKWIIVALKNHPLTSSSRKYRADVRRRMLNWQLNKKKYIGVGKEIKWINDLKLAIYPRRASGTGNYYYGLLEYEPMAFLYHYIDEEDTLFDVGANVGVYTVLAKHAKHVVSFEPAEDTISVLKRNIELNSMSNVDVVAKGVSDQNGTIRFTSGLDSTNHIAVDGEPSVEIDTVTMDTVVKEQNVVPTIIKIDAEGAEAQIISGGYNTLSDKRVNVVIMEIFGEDNRSKLLSDFGFKLYGYNPKSRNFYEQTAKEAGHDGIYIKDISLAREKIKRGSEIYYGGVRID